VGARPREPARRQPRSSQAGGGWVNHSEPEAEFQETVNKSKAMLKAVALAETFSNPSQ
jgi:anthranilate/para-aminobenzoate synthase component I